MPVLAALMHPAKAAMSEATSRQLLFMQDVV